MFKKIGYQKAHDKCAALVCSQLDSPNHFRRGGNRWKQYMRCASVNYFEAPFQARKEIVQVCNFWHLVFNMNNIMPWFLSVESLNLSKVLSQPLQK